MQGHPVLGGFAPELARLEAASALRPHPSHRQLLELYPLIAEVREALVRLAKAIEATGKK
jgi:hypothetical protein